MSKIILFPFVIIIAIYSVIVFIVPTFKEISSIKEEIKNQEIRKEKLDKDFVVLQNFIKDATSHKAEQEFLKSFVPNNVQEDNLVNTISRYASESGITIISLSFSPSKNNSSKSEMNYAQKTQSTVSVVGTYENLHKFIERMFIINRLYDFTEGNVEVMKITNQDNAISNQLNLTLTFDYFSTTSGRTINDVKKLGKVNYSNITKIKNKVSNTADIESTVQARQNPFAP